jgi:hypothetical protein
VLGTTSDHEAVALGAAPDAAAGAGVDEADAAPLELHAPPYGVVPVGVAPLDHHVARLQKAGQVGDDALGGVARGDHDPYQAGRVQPLGQLGE